MFRVHIEVATPFCACPTSTLVFGTETKGERTSLIVKCLNCGRVEGQPVETADLRITTIPVPLPEPPKHFRD